MTMLFYMFVQLGQHAKAISSVVRSANYIVYYVFDEFLMDYGLGGATYLDISLFEFFLVKR